MNARIFEVEMAFFKRSYRAFAYLGVASAIALMAAGPLPFVTAAHAESDSAEQMRLKKFQKKGDVPSVVSNAGSSSSVGGGKVTTQTEVVADKNLTPMVTADAATALSAVADRYRQIISSGGFPLIPKGTYKKGATSKGVAVLNQRLFIDGYLRAEATQGEFAAIYTTATEDAVSRFQRNMGLAVTGKVDGATLQQLNIPAGERLRTIEANIPRLQTYGTDLGDRYLIVNVPSQQIETVSNGRVYSHHNAIVGRPERPTPVVMTALSDINFNPYWNAPASIVEKDIIPKLHSGTQILEEMNIKVFDGVGGPEVDPNTVNWNTAVADNYHFRQEPGGHNAMATAKINFSSPFGIYLHDTPEKQLFNSGNRFFSSGCVRVEKMSQLVDWVLNGQDGIGPDQISALAETLERRDVKLATPPQLRVTYLTAWPVGNTVAFRNDIYQLDGTGFTVGQPLPVGELSAENQRFVLKPVPRVAGAVDADEAEGFGLFGRAFSRNPTKKPAFGTSPQVNAAPSTTAKKKPVLQTAVAAKKPADKKAKSASPGLFDWAAYRKEQATGKKPVVVTKKAAAVKKPATAKPKTAVADAAATDKKLSGKATKPVATTVVAKKPVVTDAAKKPAADAPKVAANCKPAADGKLPAGCKPPLPVKKVAPATDKTAAN